MELDQAKLKFAHAGNEAAIIACVLRDPNNYYEVEAKLTDVDFLTPTHKALWTILKGLVREGVASLDASSILTHAKALDLEKHIGGYDYITALFDKSIDPSNINFYIQRVLDASVKFKVVQATKDIEDLAEKNKTLTGETLTADHIVEYSQNQFLQISIDTQKSAEAKNISEGLPELLQEIQQSPLRGLDTGFTLLDNAINGLENGTLTVLGARPKVGKSAFLLNVARKIALSTRVPVLYIDTEMTTREQQLRLLSNLSSVPERNIKDASYLDSDRDVQAVEEAIQLAESGLILHKYYPDFTAEGIASLARKYNHQFGVGCVIFDYIKLPDADLQLIGNVKEHQALGYLVVSLKNLAGQLQIPVLAAAQIGRTGANKGHVAASDFADSDRILRYANSLISLSIKPPDEQKKLQEEYGREQALAMGTHRLQILETRAGGTNFTGLDIYFRKKTITMREADVQLFNLLPQEGDEDGLE